jgi:hypothetical protein
MPKKRKVHLLVTGKTEQQWIDEIRVLQLVEEQGIRAPRVRTCYLCKRGEGENSLCLFQDKKDEVNLTPIQLGSYSTEMEGEVTLHYLLCHECAVLLNVM